MTQPESKRCFSAECKPEATEQVVTYQQRITDVAIALQPDASMPGKWVRQYRRERHGMTPAGALALTPEQRRIQQPEKQVSRLQMEQEILRQAAVLMSDIRQKSVR